MSDRLPELDYAAWRPTKDTLHLYAQIVGKIRLATTPPQNHWWHVPLYVDVRGLRTGRMQASGRSFDLAFDLVDHALVLRVDDGRSRSFRLVDGLSVARFYGQLFDALGEVGIDVQIRATPFGVPMSTPFADDVAHASYDRDAVERYWHALLWIDWVLREFAGWFCGKSSPVHLFWHSFDLALTRFSGQPAPPLAEADGVTREAYSHRAISFGFWAGDENTREAAFYSYTAPEPEHLTDERLAAGASWIDTGTGSMALLPYDTVRSASDPRQALLAFLQSGYEAGVRADGWPEAELRSAWCPPRGEPAIERP